MKFMRALLFAANLLVLAALGGDAPATASMAVEASGGKDEARVRLIWLGAVKATAAIEGEAVVMTVDRPIDAAAVADLAAMVPGWIAAADLDGQRIRLTPAAGRVASAAPLSRGVEVTLTRRSAAVAAPAAATPEPQLASTEPGQWSDASQPAASEDAEAAAVGRRLRLTKARLLMETGQPAAAKRELVQLLSEVPDSVEIMAALASAETQLGGWRRATALYDRALGLNPEDPTLERAHADLRREHGPRVRLDLDHRRVRDGDRQTLAKLSGEAHAGLSTLGFAFESNKIEAPLVRRLDGAVEDFKGRRVRGEAYVAVDHDGGGATRFSLLGGNGVLGAAIRHTTPFADGALRAALVVQEPYWDAIDGLVNEARSDRVQARYERLLGDDWRVAGGLAIGRYGVSEHSDVGRFVAPSFELAKTVYQGPPSVTLAYGLDAEYLGGTRSTVDAFGREYPLLSVVSREVHSATVGLSGVAGTALRYNVFGGYAYDRLNANGPFFGADIAYEPLPNFEIGVAASHSLTAARGTDAVVTRIGGYLLWRF
jgi:tetratricopeptide (TPR) repeat protein